MLNLIKSNIYTEKNDFSYIENRKTFLYMRNNQTYLYIEIFFTDIKKKILHIYRNVFLFSIYEKSFFSVYKHCLPPYEKYNQL